MTNYSDDILPMQAVQRFEPDAEHVLFRQVYKPLCLYAHKLTGNLPAAEDIVSEIFVKAFNRRKEFTAAGNFKAFLYVAVRNACLSYRKSDLRQRQAIERITVLQSAEDTKVDPLLQNEMLFSELVHVIHQEIENLPGKCRRVFKMSFLDLLPTETIATELSINPQTVRSHKARAIQMLRAEILKKNRFPAMYLALAIMSELAHVLWH